MLFNIVQDKNSQMGSLFFILAEADILVILSLKLYAGNAYIQDLILKCSII